MSRLERSNQDDPSTHFRIPIGAGGIGWGLAGVLCIALGLALGIAMTADAELPVEHEIIGWVQGSGDQRWDDLAWVGSRIGDIWPGVLLAAFVLSLLCAMTGRQTMAFVFLIAAGMRLLSTPLKLAFISPRPPLELIRLSEGFSGFGYPSGHAFGATLIYGTVIVFADQLGAQRWLRWCLAIAAGFVIVLVAWSRVRLGVHWPSDVVGGLLFGFGFLAVLRASLIWKGRLRVRQP